MNVLTSHNRNVPVTVEKMWVSINHQSVLLIQKSQEACVFKVYLYSTYNSYLYIFACHLILYKRKYFIGSDFLLMFLSHFVNILGSCFIAFRVIQTRKMLCLHFIDGNGNEIAFWFWKPILRKEIQISQKVSWIHCQVWLVLWV